MLSFFWEKQHYNAFESKNIIRNETKNNTKLPEKLQTVTKIILKTVKTLMLG